MVTPEVPYDRSKRARAGHRIRILRLAQHGDALVERHIAWTGWTRGDELARAGSNRCGGPIGPPGRSDIEDAVGFETGERSDRDVDRSGFAGRDDDGVDLRIPPKDLDPDDPMTRRETAQHGPPGGVRGCVGPDHEHVRKRNELPAPQFSGMHTERAGIPTPWGRARACRRRGPAGDECEQGDLGGSAHPPRAPHALDAS